VDPNTDLITPTPTSPVSAFLTQVQVAEMARERQADGDLLTAYVQTRDEVAFAALVHRHAPMVWGVCRRLLRRQHDAEDAFQAAFLVFVQKAAGISDRSAVANWLYGVAHQTSVRVRANAMKTNRRERPGLAVTDPPAPVSRGDDDLCGLIDAEVVALPDKYRAVVVLCDLEERPRSEVARRLGVPEGTVAGRLARAREMLAKRFLRRGLVLSGGVAGLLTAESSVTASVPAAVVASTVQAAGLAAAGHLAIGVTSAQTVAVTHATLRSMALAKVKVAAFVVAAGIVFGASGVATYRAVGAGGSASSPPVATVEIKLEPVKKPDPDPPKPKKGNAKPADEDDKQDNDEDGKDKKDENEKPRKKK
jgi:RNA polymerase sigma factor (sigma-70 family)